MTNIIDIKQLILRFDKIILLNNFNLEIKKNKRIGLTGPSGCGKTTLIKGIIEHSFPNGSNFNTFYRSEKIKIGYVPQNNGLLPWFTLKKNFEIFSQKNISLIPEITNIFKLNDCINSFPKNISGGEHQRALIACSILSNPDLYIADEPLTEVDMQKKWLILQYWSNIIKEQSASLIVVSHDIDTLIYLCDEIIILSDKPSSILKSINIQGEHPRDYQVILNSKIRNEIYEQLK